MNAGTEKTKKRFCAPGVIILLAAFILSAGQAAAGETDLWQIGGRLGFSDGRNDEDFSQAEVFAARQLPLPFASGDRLSSAVLLEASAGLLSGANTHGFVGAVGPGLAIDLWGERLRLKAGISPTVISQDRYGDEDLGGPIQFTSHVGASVKIYQAAALGYRFQHMSNAGLYRRNPGLNLHVVEVSWRF